MTVRLACRTAGDAAAPPLVLLHSIATSSAMWHAQMEIWAQHFRLVAFDLPGHGESPAATGTPSIAALADAVVAGCEAMGIGQARFVGLSLGSMITQHLAATRPELVARAVLSNGIAVTPPAGAAMWTERAAAARKEGMAPQVEATIERWFTPAFRLASPLTMTRFSSLIGNTQVEGYGFAAAAIGALDHRDILPRIACPTLVVAGDEDHVAAPPAALRAMAEIIPGARYVSLPAAHLANVELPVPYTELVGRYLCEEG